MTVIARPSGPPTGSVAAKRVAGQARQRAVDIAGAAHARQGLESNCSRTAEPPTVMLKRGPAVFACARERCSTGQCSRRDGVQEDRVGPLTCGSSRQDALTRGSIACARELIQQAERLEHRQLPYLGAADIAEAFVAQDFIPSAARPAFTSI